MEQVAEVQRVQAQLAARLQVQVRVVPEGNFAAVLVDVEPVEQSQVGVQGDERRLELGLESEAESETVDLRVVVQVVLDLVVLDFGVGEGVEADGVLADELGVQTDLVVSVVVVVEERSLGHTSRAAFPTSGCQCRWSGGPAWGAPK